MTKKSLLFILTMIGISLQGYGQQKVVVPKFQKFVKVDAGVNIRKSPSTTSQRLIEYYNPEDEGGESSGITVKWEEARDRRYKPKAVNADIIPVMGETGDWYQVYYSNGYDWGMEAFSGVAYISKKFCHDVELAPVSFTPSNKAQAFKDYFIEIDDGGGDLVLHLGKHTGGMLVRLQSKDWVGYDEIEKLTDRENPTDANFRHLITLFTNKASSLTYRAKGSNEEYKINLDEYIGPTIEM